MHAILVRIANELHSCWRFRWWMLLVAWLVCLSGWFYVLRMPNIYEATARVYFDSKGALGSLVQGLTVDPNAGQQLHYVRNLLLSRPQLERVARETELDLRARTPQAMESLITSLRDRIIITSDSLVPYSTSDGLYRISFQDTNREKSLAVVQTLANHFIALSSKQSGETEALDFIKKQIDELGGQLAEAERQRLDFRRRNAGLLPGEGGDYFARVSAVQLELDTATRDLRAAQARAQEYDKQLSGEEPVFFGFDDAGASAEPGDDTSTDVGVQLRAWKKKLADLRTRYQEKYYEVVEARQKVEELEAQQKTELERLRRGMRGNGSMAQSTKVNPVYQGLQIDKKNTEVEIADLQQRVALHSQTLSTLKRQREGSIQVSLQLDQLNRDYDLLKSKQQDLVKRRSAAEFTEDVDRAQAFKFRQIDPPSVPLSPIGPNRNKYLSAILLLGLFAGGGLGVLLSQLRPVFHDARTLAESVGVPVLGSVSRIWDEERRAQRRSHLALFSAAVGLLVIVYGAVIFLQVPGVALVARVMS
jgi:polysaccharide chain length determinant protein (PEP-CTERM system associated)